MQRQEFDFEETKESLLNQLRTLKSDPKQLQLTSKIRDDKHFTFISLQQARRISNNEVEWIGCHDNCVVQIKSDAQECE